MTHVMSALLKDEFISFIGIFYSVIGLGICRGVYSSIIPPVGGKESKALRAREENQRVKKKGREGKGKEKGKGKGKEKGRKRKENKSTNLLMKEEKI